MTDKRKKVLLITPNFNGRKSWMQCAIITAKNLSECGFDVTVLTANTEKQAVFDEKDGVKVHRVDGFLLPDPINMSVPNVFAFWKKLDELKSDIVIINKTWFLTSLIASVYYRLHKIKYYVQLDTMVGVIWFGQNKLMNLAMWIYARTINRYILKGSKQCIIYHSGLIETMEKWKQDYSLISQGVDVDKFFHALPSNEILNFTKGRVCFLYVGRLDEIKRWHDYLTVCKRVAEKRGNVCFVFVCGGKHESMRKELTELNDANKFLFLGFRSDVANIMKACDVFVLPSKSEGMPDVVMEAMSSNMAIISSRVGGVPGLIKDGESGYLFDSFDELEKKMLLLTDFKSRREAFAKEAFLNVQQHDNEKIKEKLKKVLTA